MKIYRLEVGMLATNCYIAMNEELKEGVIVRFLGDKELVDYVRVSVGTMKENEIFIKALKKVLNK